MGLLFYNERVAEKNGVTAYDHKSTEAKWAKVWVDRGLYSAGEDYSRKKSYILIEFPYPSGERLHVGHARSYSCLDAVARKRRMQGENVVFPFGWDAFGLPAENYAIKTGVHPAITTAENIKNAKAQAISWGLSFDWSREVNTSDSLYYRWTQWIFIQLFKNGLAYKAEIGVNWCPACKINLANEEVIDGKCERCGAETTRRMQSQWLLRITKYAERLLDDLETVSYREDIKLQQQNWIGRKEGINIIYRVEGGGGVEVFTTRPDTNFGATFVVVAPEHDLARRSGEKNKEVADYVAGALNKSELERLAEGKRKTGVFTGLFAVNGLNGEKLPIWVSDFVIGSVGTGAVVGVPGHDERDFEFAKAMGLPVKRVVVAGDGDASEIREVSQVQEDEGVMVNSGFLDGMDIGKAKEEMMDYLEKKGWGKRKVAFHLRDWVFSRQHYWGEPIPMVYCSGCDRKKESWFSRNGKSVPGDWESAGWYPVEEGELPVKLPRVEKYQPTDTGESPLSAIGDWVKTRCPGCGGPARRETDTMPNWAGSSWYYLRYCDPDNSSSIASSEKLKYWLPVDWYNGGMEHTTLHLLYSRFWHKFLFDLGVVPVNEPYAKRTSHGVVLGPDGKRMSKSRGNVVNPDEVVSRYGADTLRLYEMFIGPFDQMVVWSQDSVSGVRRFIDRVWRLANEAIGSGRKKSSPGFESEARFLVAKIESDLEAMKFNTAVSASMEFVNLWAGARHEVGRDVVEVFVRALAPMAPFVSEEIWQMLHPEGEYESVHRQKWPEVGERNMRKSTEIVVEVNGKMRGKVPISGSNRDEDSVKQSAMASASIARWLEGHKVRRVVWVPDKLINFVLGD